MRIATFNVQNLRLRHAADHAELSGAVDMFHQARPSRTDRGLDAIDRLLTAAILRRADADVVALQEVFDLETLDHFHDRFLVAPGVEPYPYRACFPGNDGRGFDVALLSRIKPHGVMNHAATTAAELDLETLPGRDPGEPVFRRDCLVATIRSLTLFICHFKAPYPSPDEAWIQRRLEAQAVRRLVERQFANRDDALWMIVGDLNEPFAESHEERAIAPLLGGFSVDLVQRVPAGQQWSFHMPEGDLYSRPDVMLASPALARRWPDAHPVYLREGLGRDASRYAGARLPGVGEDRPHASDHAALVIDLKGL